MNVNIVGMHKNLGAIMPAVMTVLDINCCHHLLQDHSGWGIGFSHQHNGLLSKDKKDINLMCSFCKYTYV